VSIPTRRFFVRKVVWSGAWTWALRPVRTWESLIRKRIISRSSRVLGGAIQASARRPRRKRSARSRASRSSFFTRRWPQPMAPVVAVRIGQMDLVTHLFEQIRAPVPAVGRLDDDVAAHRGHAHSLGELTRLVVDPDRVDLLSGLVHSVNDRPAAVQVYADILFFHRGLPCREGLV
jgi:hypothetical protein